MAEVRYIVIHTNEDGEAHMEILTEEILVDRLNEEWWGLPKFLGPEDGTTDYGGTIDLCAKSGTYIIKGEFIKPIKKEVVIAWAVP